ncbi:MAG: flavodoxin [Bacillota bacterium]|nr:flavodoxin [Bacillota bacterium]
MPTTCLIVYTSMTGNTEEMANAIGEGIKKAGVNVEIKDVLMTDTKDLLDFDGILLGSYTWGDGGLPDEYLDFYDEMDQLNLTGKKAAVFGSCDSSYEERGKAVDTLIEKLVEIEADVVLDGLKIDLTPTKDEREDCKQFGIEFAKKLGGGD